MKRAKKSFGKITVKKRANVHTKEEKKRQIASDVKTLLWSLEAIRYKTQEYNGSTQVLYRNIRSSASLWLPVSSILLLSVGGGIISFQRSPEASLLRIWWHFESVRYMRSINKLLSIVDNHHTLSTPHFHTTSSSSDWLNLTKNASGNPSYCSLYSSFCDRWCTPARDKIPNTKICFMQLLF